MFPALTKVCEELGISCLPRNVMGWEDAKEALRERFVRCEEDPTGGDPEQWKSNGRDGLETETCDTTIPDYCECIYVHRSLDSFLPAVARAALAGKRV